MTNSIGEQELRSLIKHGLSSQDQAPNGSSNGASPNAHKDAIRLAHAAQRADRLARESATLGPKVARLIDKFALGSEVVPEKITPRLIEVGKNGPERYLFRMAASLWSVPVSSGYGRRMRFLVEDANNGKIIGIFALGDPVIGLRPRDAWIGWSVKQRNARLSSVMDAYVCGAVPPYNSLLGGKLVTSLIGSRQVNEAFDRKYRYRPSQFSGAIKNPRLVLVTVTSAYGRSSMYNRVKLPGLVNLLRLKKMTGGWGHFTVSDEVFGHMRDLLRLKGHKYADGYSWDENNRGPNWRMRTIRAASEICEIETDALNHGIERELFAMPLATNWRRYLLGQVKRCNVALPSARTIGVAARDRWMVPRSVRTSEWSQWTAEQRAEAFRPLMAGRTPLLA